MESGVGTPSFDRGCATIETIESGSKMVVIFGSSHSSRIADKLMTLEVPVTNCAAAGWLLNKGSAKCLISKINELDLGCGSNEDVVVLDLLSNTSFAGTDEDGSTLPAQKLCDGKWHVIGDLASVLKAKLKNLAGKLPLEKTFFGY